MTFTEIYYDSSNIQHQSAVYMATDKKTAEMFNLTYAGDRIVNFNAVDDWNCVNSCLLKKVDDTNKYRILQVGGYSYERGMYVDLM